jgi:hypothetical protein
MPTDLLRHYQSRENAFREMASKDFWNGYKLSGEGQENGRNGARKLLPKNPGFASPLKAQPAIATCATGTATRSPPWS